MAIQREIWQDHIEGNLFKNNEFLLASTIAQIQQSIIDAKQADATLSGLTSTSNVAIWLLWTYVVAVCQWVLEQFFDAHKKEVSDIIATQKPHTLQWYVTKAKQFQYGVALMPETDTYSSISDDPTIAIINYAAAIELTNLVRVKVATNSAGALAPITTPQLTALRAYMQLIKDAGVRLQVTSTAPDELQLMLTIYYDPLVFDVSGGRIDGTSSYPVMDAIKEFLKKLPFNGVFVINNLLAAMQQVEGVVIGVIDGAAARYAALPFLPVTVEYTPDAGYMVLDEAFMIANTAYFPHGPIA